MGGGATGYLGSSLHIAASGTKLLERGWTLFFSRVASGERRQGKSSRAVNSSPSGELHQMVEEGVY